MYSTLRIDFAGAGDTMSAAAAVSFPKFAARYTRLKSGRWGIWVVVRFGHSLPEEGAEIPVKQASGDLKEERLGERVGGLHGRWGIYEKTGQNWSELDEQDL